MSRRQGVDYHGRNVDASIGLSTCYPKYRMYVIGTAGHVDHGKSTLIMALTGIDPDRLQEEKDRSMTIDLGFASLVLPSGRKIGVVDVPGHERFIKNMLAGVGGIDLALFVVAADESVMPQTREHLAILNLLQVKRCIAVITKSDLVENDLLELVKLEVEELLSGTTMQGSPIVCVSAKTKQSLDELISEIDNALDQTEERSDLGRPRLAIDRGFTLRGFGTVVTGTLLDGTLNMGQEIELLLVSIKGRIRGLESHGVKQETALPGSRVAVNLSGISHNDIARGMVLTTPGWLKPTKAIDVRLQLLPSTDKGLAHNHPVTFFAHTADISAKVRLLEGNLLEPGKEGWAQIVLKEPVALIRDDRFIIRSSDITLGGGIVSEIHAIRHRKNNPSTIQRLEVLSQGSPIAQIIEAIETHEPTDIASIARRANISEEKSIGLAEEAIKMRAVVRQEEGPLNLKSILYTSKGWDNLTNKIFQTLKSFHNSNPLVKGMPREQLRTQLKQSPQNFPLILQKLASTKMVVESESLLKLPDHKVSVSISQRAQMDAFVRQLEENPYDPSLPPLDAKLINLLVEDGQVVKANDNVYFAISPYEDMVSKVKTHLGAKGTITVAEVRDMFKTSRKYALSLLEHLDELKVTRRNGDERILLER